MSVETDSDMAASGSDFGSVQLAAATDAPIPVNIPRGQQIVVIPVKPGQTIELPTDSPDGLLAKLGADGNLAIVIDGRTIILQGYVAANEKSPITIVTNDGDVVDIVEVLAGTLPDLDIQTAAGPAAAGAQGAAGGDGEGSGIFVPFAAGPLLGGLDAVGVLDPTLLQYKLIDDERVEFVREEEEETPPNPPTIDFFPNDPLVKDGKAVVSDEGLPGGNKDSSPAGDDTDDAVASGTFVVSDPDVGDTLTVTLLTDGLPTTFNGQPVTWILSPDGHTLTGQTAGSDAIVIKISTVDGFLYNYSVELKKPFNHSDPLSEDEFNFSLGVKVTDSTGLSDTAHLAIQIEDDIPENNEATISKTVFEDGLATGLSTGIGGGATTAVFTAA
ncbi:hypothetical protein, partial [Dongia deserti]|uniref:hypothetical protein n=1 Tax=Dongia deserti TaxID=2268030 RepID=UPI0025487BD1